jgi:hypothetical protein
MATETPCRRDGDGTPHDGFPSLRATSCHKTMETHHQTQNTVEINRLTAGIHENAMEIHVYLAESN